MCENIMHNTENRRRSSTQNSARAEQRRQRSHVDAIVALLRSRHGEWVALSEIMQVGGAQYGARIHFARHVLGLHIENRSELTEVARQSWFRLRTNEQPISSRSPTHNSSKEPLQSRVQGEFSFE
jgi:hypothetical protein